MENENQTASLDFLTRLKNDIDNWLKSEACKEIPSIFSCEADFQLRLCKYISDTGKYDRVIPEYKVPFGLVELVFEKNGYPVPSITYPWVNDLRLDLVVKDKGSDDYAVIELKYATKEILTDSLFGEIFDKKVQLLKDHEASNLVMYNYWKDVRRIEMLCRNFKNVVGGLAVMMTNSDTFLRKPDESKAAYAPFSTYPGHEIGKPDSSSCLKWSRDVKVEENYPPFIIDGFYKCEWHDTCFNNPEIPNGVFHYLINEIRAPKSAAYAPYSIMVNGNTTVGELTDKFFDDFGLTLKVKKGNRNLSSDTLLTEVGGKTGKIEFRSSITVKGLITKIKQKFNLDVSIFTKDSWVAVLPDITLSNAGQIGTGATKAKMEKFRSYKRTKINNQNL